MFVSWDDVASHGHPSQIPVPRGTLEFGPQPPGQPPFRVPHPQAPKAEVHSEVGTESEVLS